MRKISLLLFTAILFHSFIGCTPNDEDLVVIQGAVTDAESGDAITGATVQILNPAELSDRFTRTDSVGQYSFGNIEVSELTNVSLSASATDYTSQTRSVQIASGDNITGFDFDLASDTDDGVDDGDGDDDDGGVSGPSAGAAAIILSSVSDETINIAETGGNVNTSFTFQVQDSSGRSLDLNNSEEVEFSILAGPNGGEGITPITATTNANGTVTSNLYSGNLAGVVQIQAIIVREDIGLTIRSKPVAITIHGGFPVLDNFSISAQSYNFEGFSINGNTNELTVIVGDQFNNPVKPGTAVYFTTTGGIIQGSGPGHTNSDGFVNVNLISADPRPNDSQTIDGTNFPRPGLSTVTASTVNANSEVITKSTNVLFTSSRAVITANPTTFDLDPNGGASFAFTVTDINGNPMAAGTQVDIEAGDGIEVTGATNFTLGNEIFPGPGATEFNFSIRDTDDESNDPADLTLKITVTTPSGEQTIYDQISGTRRKTSN